MFAWGGGDQKRTQCDRRGEGCGSKKLEKSSAVFDKQWVDFFTFPGKFNWRIDGI